MADLGDLLGTLMASLVRARQIADEATASAAERYRQHPLLEGMSIPRVRIPELTVEVPVLLKTEDPGQPAEANPPEVIAAEVRNAIESTMRRRGLELPGPVISRIEARVLADLSSVRPAPRAPRQRGPQAAPHAPVLRPPPPGAPIGREGVARRVELSVLDELKSKASPKLEEADVRELANAARLAALEAAEKAPGRPPSLGASVVTAEVKDQAGPSNTTRIFLTLREEGLEWTTISSSDGTTRRRLTPE